MRSFPRVYLIELDYNNFHLFPHYKVWKKSYKQTVEVHTYKLLDTYHLYIYLLDIWLCILFNFMLFYTDNGCCSALYREERTFLKYPHPLSLPSWMASEGLNCINGHWAELFHVPSDMYRQSPITQTSLCIHTLIKAFNSHLTIFVLGWP